MIMASNSFITNNETGKASVLSFQRDGRNILLRGMKQRRVYKRKKKEKKITTEDTKNVS